MIVYMTWPIVANPQEALVNINNQLVAEAAEFQAITEVSRDHDTGFIFSVYRLDDGGGAGLRMIVGELHMIEEA